MSTNILSAVRNIFTSELISKASDYLGEDLSKVKKSMDLIIPATLSSVVNKSETGNISSLLSSASQAFDSGILNNVTDFFSSSGSGIPSIGPTLISSIFGDKFGGFANAISSFTGLKGSSSSSLISSVLMSALGLIGKFTKDTNASPSEVSNLLKDQKQSILSAIPSGFDISKFFGGVEKPKTPVAHTPTYEKPRTNWLLPLLLGLGGLLLLLWLWRSCNKKEVAAVVPIDTVVVNKPDTLPVISESIKVILPNGVEINALRGGIEDKLVSFLKDGASVPGNDNWFDFNQLNFEFGTTQIIPESRGEIDNIKEILKAFPTAKIKIGGYTDKVGNEAANKKLSQERADAVAEALKTLGVGSQVVGAEGYGSEFAKFSADAPEEDRVKDRRISVSVREK